MSVLYVSIKSTNVIDFTFTINTLQNPQANIGKMQIKLNFCSNVITFMDRKITENIGNLGDI